MYDKWPTVEVIPLTQELHAGPFAFYEDYNRADMNTTLRWILSIVAYLVGAYLLPALMNIALGAVHIFIPNLGAFRSVFGLVIWATGGLSAVWFTKSVAPSHKTITAFAAAGLTVLVFGGLTVLDGEQLTTAEKVNVLVMCLTAVLAIKIPAYGELRTNGLAGVLSAIAGVVIWIIALAFYAVAIAYMIDGLREVFIDRRLWLLILLVFFSVPILLVLRWAATIIAAPVEAVRQGSYVALLFVPVGLVVGYLLWRVSNWIVYGLLDFEPWAYNFFFGWMGLAR